MVVVTVMLRFGVNSGAPADQIGIELCEVAARFPAELAGQVLGVDDSREEAVRGAAEGEGVGGEGLEEGLVQEAEVEEGVVADEDGAVGAEAGFVEVEVLAELGGGGGWEVVVVEE